LDDSHKLIFRCPETDSATIQEWIARMEQVSEADASSGGLGKLNLLLEATTLMHSQLPLDAVLDAMMDRAIAITNADRGVLLESDGSNALRSRLERRAAAEGLPAVSSPPSQTALSMALKQQSAVITEDLHQARVY
jgi:GAF domain-containing protein